MVLPPTGLSYRFGRVPLVILTNNGLLLPGLSSGRGLHSVWMIRMGRLPMAIRYVVSFGFLAGKVIDRQ